MRIITRFQLTCAVRVHLGNKNLITTIERLQGCELSAVSFVRDYVEFHFDGPILRAIINPVVLNAERITSNDIGWRNALCSFIGQQVAVIKITDENCALKFKNESMIKLIYVLKT